MTDRAVEIVARAIQGEIVAHSENGQGSGGRSLALIRQTVALLAEWYDLGDGRPSAGPLSPESDLTGRDED